jgi:hypothetical protein
MKDRNTMRLPRIVAWVAAGFICLTAGICNVAAQPPAENKIPAETCLGCHGIEGFGVPDATGQMRSLYVDKDKFKNSVHGKWQCVDCHKQITQVPHEKLDRIKVSCVECHQNLWEEAKENNTTQQNPRLAVVIQQIDRYMKSIHSRPSREDQSATNATCYNCHEPHYVYSKGTPIREEWRLNTPNICGKCHEGELALYTGSVHGKEVLQNHNPKAAVCADCHTNHDIDDPSLDSIKLVITRNCGNCHQENLKSYLETYHGQVNKLGFANTAKCFDCHGNHGIQRVSDPSSMMFPANRVQTDRKSVV